MAASIFTVLYAPNTSTTETEGVPKDETPDPPLDTPSEQSPLNTTSLPPTHGSAAPSKPKRSTPQAARGSKGTRHLPRAKSSGRPRRRMVKLSVRVNGERGQSGSVVSLPADAPDLPEVCSRIQQSMHLDRQLRFARELFLPDGTKLHSVEQVFAAAEAQATVTVGSGEPFDHDSLPTSAAILHHVGGGRNAAVAVKRTLRATQKKKAQEQARRVRGQGMASIMSDRSRAIQEKRHFVEQLKSESETLAARHPEDLPALGVVVEQGHEQMVSELQRRQRLQEIRRKYTRGKTVDEELVQLEMQLFDQIDFLDRLEKAELADSQPTPAKGQPTPTKAVAPAHDRPKGSTYVRLAIRPASSGDAGQVRVELKPTLQKPVYGARVYSKPHRKP
ncbi:hypothetical protein AB1Y20_011602 [Prymnesium parvum]|uniref:Uncharacterized protein n=1 Tax=Prymnesium parvum TaxID=97485 RepID=A0AB34IJJ8_PRYPA